MSERIKLSYQVIKYKKGPTQDCDWVTYEAARIETNVHGFMESADGITTA